MAINPETSAWVHALLEQEIERAVAPLRQELDQLDDWANGVFAALTDVLPLLLRKHPDIAADLEPMWRHASERWQRLQQPQAQADDFHETEHLLEARKMLYRQLAVLGAWPGVDAQDAARAALERAGWQAPPDA